MTKQQKRNNVHLITRHQPRHQKQQTPKRSGNEYPGHHERKNTNTSTPNLNDERNTTSERGTGVSLGRLRSGEAFHTVTVWFLTLGGLLPGLMFSLLAMPSAFRPVTSDSLTQFVSPLSPLFFVRSGRMLSHFGLVSLLVPLLVSLGRGRPGALGSPIVFPSLVACVLEFFFSLPFKYLQACCLGFTGSLRPALVALVIWRILCRPSVLPIATETPWLGFLERVSEMQALKAEPHALGP